MSPRMYAIVIVVAWLLTSVVMRIVLHRARTGSTGINRLRARPGSIEWIGGVLFVVSLVVMCITAIATRRRDDWTAWGLLGAAMATLGGGLTFVAQGSMGDSWRIGVDHSEQTALQTAGLYSIVRNPIFSAMILTAVGLAVLVPSLATVSGLIGLVVSIENRISSEDTAIASPTTKRTPDDSSRNPPLAAGRNRHTAARVTPGIGRLRDATCTERFARGSGRAHEVVEDCRRERPGGRSHRRDHVTSRSSP
jgi:protein-S-isoprenylcysteine O-methyltransferase Ste14